MAVQIILRTASGATGAFEPGQVGPHGCTPCWGCGRRPAEGETVWQDAYGSDLYCDGCARAREVVR